VAGGKARGIHRPKGSGGASGLAGKPKAPDGSALVVFVLLSNVGGHRFIWKP
jgi:hypothetical protein